jgi:hypothetical protein
LGYVPAHGVTDIPFVAGEYLRVEGRRPVTKVREKPVNSCEICTRKSRAISPRRHTSDARLPYSRAAFEEKGFRI